ncbi:MAG: ThuA domain-containing protein [Bacteroidota bacterium]
MKKIIFILIPLLCLGLSGCKEKREGKARVLVFSKTLGFKHASIPNGIAAIQKLGAEHEFEVDTTTNAAFFEDENLGKYSTVIFLNTTGNVLGPKEEAAFERYIQAGGGFVGVHSASDTEYSWGWYGKMVGAYFQSHPRTQEAKFLIRDKHFGATKFFQKSSWTRTDELYNFKKLNPNVKVLLSVDETSYEGGENGENHPMSWYHDYDGGRAFYTALGHTKDSYTEESFLKHLLGGIKYAIGENLALDYSKARSQIPPDADRFTKVPLSQGKFNEPTEMAVLPNFDVLIAERRGRLWWYNNESKEMKEVAQLDVYFKAEAEGVNAEEGFMGLQKDPNYAQNHWIYAFYSPAGDEWVNRLSRFKFKDGVLDRESEQVILDVASDRNICCHTAGSIAFGPGGLLYLSTGDNSTPFDEKGAPYVNNGYAPLNDEPGKKQYDARRSSGNTNDLRGKILRIKVNEDGSYDIPQGNLFPPGTDKTRPEIFTMGHRNPYRISVDPKKGYVYWGDVGPDSRTDSLDKRGPRGYDEMNQAKKAGNFGWPLFVADNKPYFDYDYSNGTSGMRFDPEKPINDSRNNTGLRELPPAQGAYVYYDYAGSNEFPETGAGGRNAMAGPVYYKDLYKGDRKLPDYYDGKVIIYDWIRGWMKAVHLFPNGDFNKLEAFASEIELANLIDMEMAEDGRIYLLEYGTTWFKANDDSGLSYIEYNGGNRPPVIDKVSIDKNSGSLPLEVSLEVEAHDREKDGISYSWDFGDGNTLETKEAKISHSYDKAGDYQIKLEVIDDKKASIQADAIAVAAGNTRPMVDIQIEGGNESFFLPGVPLSYSVSVNDPEDGEEGIDPSRIFVSADYLDGYDEAALSLGHQQISLAAQGEAMVMSLDCKACHKAAEKSVGPSYTQIANKYAKDPKAQSYLRKKIIEGGNGVWGEVIMPAHPNLSNNDANLIVSYIQSLAKSQNPSLPPKGSFIPKRSQGNKVLVLTASYTDQGGELSTPLTGLKKMVIENSSQKFSQETLKEGFNHIKFGDADLLIAPQNGGWFALENIDLRGIKSAIISAGWQSPPNAGMEFELRLDSPDGPLVGKGKMPKPSSRAQGGKARIVFNKTYNKKAEKLYFVYKPKEKDKFAKGILVAISNLQFSGF